MVDTISRRAGLTYHHKMYVHYLYICIVIATGNNLAVHFATHFVHDCCSKLSVVGTFPELLSVILMHRPQSVGLCKYLNDVVIGGCKSLNLNFFVNELLIGIECLLCKLLSLLLDLLSLLLNLVSLLLNLVFLLLDLVSLLLDYLLSIHASPYNKGEMIFDILLQMCWHEATLEFSPTASIVELALDHLKWTSLLQVSFEVLSLHLFLPTLIGTWQRIFLTNWPVILGHFLVSSFVVAVLAGEGTQRAMLGQVAIQVMPRDTFPTGIRTVHVHVSTLPFTAVGVQVLLQATQLSLPFTTLCLVWTLHFNQHYLPPVVLVLHCSEIFRVAQGTSLILVLMLKISFFGYKIATALRLVWLQE